jgi:hypothetical protein
MMTTCSVCGCDMGQKHPTGYSHDCIKSLAAHVTGKFDAVHRRLTSQWEIFKDDQRRLDEQEARLAALESAQHHHAPRRCVNSKHYDGYHSGFDGNCVYAAGEVANPTNAQPAPPGGGEALWECVDCGAKCWNETHVHCHCAGVGVGVGWFHSDGHQTPCEQATPPAPGDATGSDEPAVARWRSLLATYGQFDLTEAGDALATRLDELRRERDTLLLTGNALAVNCDGNAKPHGLVAFIPANGPCAACEQLARADAAEAKVAGLTALVRKIGPRTVTDCAAAIRKDWPLSASLLLAIDAALTTPAQRSEGDES